jgi:hypothetical protein
MTLMSAWCRLFVLTTLFVFTVQAEAAQPALRITLASDRSTVTMADHLILDIRIENVGEAPISVFGDLRWGERGGLILHLGPWAEDGPIPLFIDEGAFMKQEATSDVLVKLNPQVFVGTTRSLQVRDLVRRPGTYNVWVEYHCPIPSTTFDRPFWSWESGSLFSSALNLHVKEQPPTNRSPTRPASTPPAHPSPRPPR